MSKKDPATKEDVEHIVNKVVTDVVGEVATEILNVMAEHFDKSEKRIKNELRAEIQESDTRNQARANHLDDRINNLENMLRPTAEKVDDHELRLRKLEGKNRLNIAITS